MSVCFPHPSITVIPAARGKSTASATISMGVARLPTDPLFYSDVLLVNIIAGSRYRLSVDSGELATGIVSGSGYVTETISSMPVYANPQLLTLDVRYSSDSTKYLPLTLLAYQTRLGASFYVAQIVDTIA